MLPGSRGHTPLLPHTTSCPLWLRHMRATLLVFKPGVTSLVFCSSITDLTVGCISALRGCSSSKQQTAGCSSGPYVQRVPQLVDLCSEALTSSCNSNSSRTTRQAVSSPRSLSTSAWATYPAQKLPGAAGHQLFRALPARLFARPWGFLYTSAATGNTTTDSIPAAESIRLPHSAAFSSAHPRRRKVPLSTDSPAAAPARQLEVDAKPPAPQRVEDDPQPDSRISGLIRRSSSARRQPSAQQASAADTATAAAAEAHAISPAGAGRPNKALNPASCQTQLTGTEEQLFARALEYVPPQASAELAEVAQLATEQRDSRRLPAHKMLQAICNILDLSQQFPDLHLAPLLRPVIAAAKTRYSLEALMPKVTRMRRLLPDTALREALLRRDPADVSQTVSRAVSAFLSILSMQPPVQLLSVPRAFVSALQLPTDSLRRHLQLLKTSVSSLEVAQQLAQRYTSALLSPSAEQLLTNSTRVGELLNRSQDDAVALVLRHPHLASTQQQLMHLASLVHDLPDTIRVQLDQWQAALVKRPELAHYSSVAALSAKYKVIKGLFPGAAPLEVLEVCSFHAVIRAVNMSTVAASLRTSAAIMGYDSPGPLLPLLLREPASYQQHDRPYAAGSGRRPYAFFFQPAERLAARAVNMQKLYSLDRKGLTRLARHFPKSVLATDSATRKLKAMLLQVQLLGDGRPFGEDQLAPEMAKMLQKCPQVTNLKHQTCLDRISNLQHLLQLTPGEASQMVLRLPQLLLYTPDKLAGLVNGINEVLGGLDKAQALALKEPQVLFSHARMQAADGQLPVVVALYQVLTAEEAACNTQQEYQQKQQQHQGSTAVGLQSAQQPGAVAGNSELPAEHTVEAAATAASQVTAAVQAAVAVVQRQGLAPVGSCKFRGVRQAWQKWEMRFAGRSMYFSTQLEAACAYDLARLAAHSRPRGAVNFPAAIYTAEHIQAMMQHQQARQSERTAHWAAQDTQKQQHLPEEAVRDEGLVLRQQYQRDQKLQGQPEDALEVQQQELAESLQAAAGPAELQELGWQLMSSTAGRQLLGMSPQAALARLQALAAITGISTQQVLEKCLKGVTHYHTVLKLSPARMESQAASLQQQLQLPAASMQALLQRAPELLQYGDDTIAAKVPQLAAAFQSCWDGISGAGSQQHPMDGWSELVSVGLVCLQHAALRVPEILLLSTSKVAGRLQALQDVCSQHGDLQQQLREALTSGAIGRWLASGDAHYDTLQHLAAARSPLLQQLKLSQYMRRSRQTLCSLE